LRAAKISRSLRAFWESAPKTGGYGKVSTLLQRQSKTKSDIDAEFIFVRVGFFENQYCPRPTAGARSEDNAGL
jgi:hypothetical protein